MCTIGRKSLLPLLIEGKKETFLIFLHAVHGAPGVFLDSMRNRGPRQAQLRHAGNLSASHCGWTSLLYQFNDCLSHFLLLLVFQMVYKHGKDETHILKI